MICKISNVSTVKIAKQTSFSGRGLAIALHQSGFVQVQTAAATSKKLSEMTKWTTIIFRQPIWRLHTPIRLTLCCGFSKTLSIVVQFYIKYLMDSRCVSNHVSKFNVMKLSWDLNQSLINDIWNGLYKYFQTWFGIAPL